jgi:hypothetical protein
MTKPNWSELVKGSVVPANPPGILTSVYDYVAAPRRLRFRATGKWDIAGTPCGPDGNPSMDKGGLLPGALNGSLIGKIGGGTADSSVPAAGTPAPAGSPFFFPVGSFCTIDLPTGVSGALFLSINDAPSGFSKHGGSITVDIDESWS